MVRNILRTVVIVFVLAEMINARDQPDICEVTYTGTIPSVVPHNVTSICIQAYNGSITRGVFAHRTWGAVTSLDLSISSDIEWDFTFEDKSFDGLSRLQYLGFHAHFLNDFGPNTFRYLDDLIELNLCNCTTLNFQTVSSSVTSGGYLPRLRTLNLDYVQTTYTRMMVLDDQFFRFVSTVTDLSLRHTRALLLVNDFTAIGPLALQHLNISNPFVIGFGVAPLNEVLQGMPYLESIDFSGTDERILEATDVYRTMGSFTWQAACAQWKFCSLKAFYMNGIFQSPLYFRNCSIKFTDHESRFRIETFHMKSNNIVELDCEAILPRNDTAREVDLSENNMRYISPRVFQNMTSLRTLLLSHNQLSFMERHPEMSRLFEALKHIEYIDLSSNGFTYIAPDTFSYNGFLKELILKNNRLVQLDFLTGMFHIERLDLRNNTITTISKSSLDSLQKHRSSDGNVNLYGNPIECSCENYEFLHWWTSHGADGTLKCSRDHDEYVITDQVVRDSNRLCYRTLIIVLWACGSAVLVSFIVGLSIYAKFKMNHLRAQKAKIRFLAKLPQELENGKYLAFVSFCKHDGEFTMTRLYPALERHLKLHIQTDEQLLCNGDQHFKPGFSLVNEIIRCASDCYVFIAVVSTHFCESEWCRMELKEAYSQQIPIILILREEVNRDVMDLCMRRVFDTMVHTSLHENNDGLEPIEGWQCFCESVVELAVTTQLYKGQCLC